MNNSSNSKPDMLLVFFAVLLSSVIIGITWTLSETTLPSFSGAVVDTFIHGKVVDPRVFYVYFLLLASTAGLVALLFIVILRWAFRIGRIVELLKNIDAKLDKLDKNGKSGN